MPDKTDEADNPTVQIVGGDPMAQLNSRSIRSARRSGRLDQLELQVQRLLERMNVAVIYGGDKTIDGAVINKTQNPRSWKSYQSVAQDIADSLQRLGCKSVHLIPDDMKLGDRLREDNIQFGWLNTGGVQGYDSMLHGAALLEMAGIPYVGHGPLMSGILDNKHTFKRQLNAFAIPTAAFMTWHISQDPFSVETNDRFKHNFEGYTGPFVVKPVCGRASQHVAVIEGVRDLKDAVALVYEATENHVLIEKFLPGREFTVAVCGQITASGRKLTQSNYPFVFSAVERILKDDEKTFTSMDIRPITMDRLRLLGADTDPGILEKIEDIARKIFIDLDIETLIRLDLRMDAKGELNILEVNPKPDLKTPTAQTTSIVCAGLQACGMDYDDLILSLFADRVDRLFCERRHMVTRFNSMLD